MRRLTHTFLIGMSAVRNYSQACSNSAKLTLPSPFLSIYAMISFHFLSSASCYYSSFCRYVLLESLEEPLFCLIEPGSSLMVYLCQVGSAFLNSSSSMTPSLLVSNNLNMYYKFYFVNTFQCSTAPAMNSWKSRRPSPSRSMFQKTQSHFISQPFSLNLCIDKLVAVFMNSSFVNVPSLLVSMASKACWSLLRSFLSDRRPVNKEIIVF